MKKIICLFLVSVVVSSSLCASEIEVPKNAYTRELEACFKKEQFLREEKEAFASGKEGLFFCHAHAGALVFFIPIVGVGARYQKGTSGFDFSLDYHTLFVVHGISAKGSYFYYFPHEDFDKQFYVGAGGGRVVYLNSYSSGLKGSGFGVITLGKKMRRKTFTQLELVATRIDGTLIVLPTFKIGVGF